MYNQLFRYERLPTAIQKIIGKIYRNIPKSILIGSFYNETKARLIRDEYLSADQLREKQNYAFLETYANALRSSFYRELYAKHGVAIESIKSIDDIKQLPTVGKSDLQSHKDRIIVPHSTAKSLYITTGGSTGVPVGFYLEKARTRAKELAFIEHLWSRFGYKQGKRTMILRGVPVATSINSGLYKIDNLRNWLVMSSVHLGESTITEYNNTIRKYQPVYIQGYPSALLLLAKLFSNQNISPPSSIELIFAGSEHLGSEEKAFISKTFNAPVYSWYGHSEKVLLGGFCEYSDKYHMHPLYGYTEILDDNGQLITSGHGELVGTNFDNRIFPLIRYRTCDNATLSDYICRCGRNHLILDSLDGRTQDILLSKTGRQVSLTYLNMHTSIFDKIKRYQYYHPIQGTVVFRYEELAPLASFEKAEIFAIIQERLGKDFDFKIECCESIPSSIRGKRILLQRDF